MMMKNLNKYIYDICDGFQFNKGKAYCYAFDTTVINELVYNIYELFIKKRPGSAILIIVNNYNTRTNILNFLLDKGCTPENNYNYKIISIDYINDKYKYAYNLIITIGINNDIDKLQKLSNDAKFMLAILTNNIMDVVFTKNLRNTLHEIKSTVTNEIIKEDIIRSPVEIHRIGIELNEEDRLLYDKYSNYIKSALIIFGDFHTIEYARTGNYKLNISGAEIRDNIARSNGWNANLDTTIEFNRKIDDIYNPNALLEYANNVYNIIKQRRDLVTDNIDKFNTIKKLIEDNIDKKIILISKRGAYASYITKSFNDDYVCIDYHDDIESNSIFDTDTNDYVRYKSGTQKGEIKIFHSQAISNLNLQRFNSNETRCLSIKNASNMKLKTATDLLIFTSSLCSSVIDFRRRYKNISFNSKPLVAYVIYCINTIEHSKFNKESEDSIYTIINDTNCENDGISYDENNDVIIS